MPLVLRHLLAVGLPVPLSPLSYTGPPSHTELISPLLICQAAVELAPLGSDQLLLPTVHSSSQLCPLGVGGVCELGQPLLLG